MNKTFAFLFFMCTASLLSCDKDGFSGNEDKQIEQYIASKNLSITDATSSGLRFILTKENASGAVLQAGQYVTVNYAGRLLNDKEFDAGTFSFILGIGQVVRGFDLGIARMRVGEKATIIFPSTLGYGNQKQGSIPKNSPLVFDIEVLKAE